MSKKSKLKKYIEHRQFKMHMGELLRATSRNRRGEVNSTLAARSWRTVRNK